MSQFTFIPTKQQTESSNLYHFMKKYDISSFDELTAKARKNLDWYWEAVENDIGIIWEKKYEQIKNTDEGIPWTKWFVNGKLNIVDSMLTKFVKKHPNKIAYHFISENNQTNSITYEQLNQEVNKLANGLKSIGVSKGDVVGIYLPMVKEAIIAMLACAKIGAIQTVIFSGYSYDSLKIRLNDSKAKFLFIIDEFYRKGKPISQEHVIDNIHTDTNVSKTIIVSNDSEKNNSSDFLNYSDLIKNQEIVCNTEIMDSEDPLFILYTSGTTGKPKGVIHTHGGFSVFAGHQAAYLIDMHENDVLFWPADIGWITGIVWNVYGLLEMGATAVVYDGAINFPTYERIWKMLEEYSVTIFGISPTAVRLFKKEFPNPRDTYCLDSIRLIPTTGEPIDSESWNWLFENVGGKKIPIMNLSGGTEIGGAMLSVFPGMKLKPTTVGMPCPGISLDVFDDDGQSVKNQKGYLVVTLPWPGMTKGLLNDDQRYLDTYWSKFDNVWFHGDYVERDNDDLWYMHGRVDDVINVSGHRISTAEIEQVTITNNKVSAAAVISIPDNITGESIVVFIVPEQNQKDLENEIIDYVSDKIGKVARPKKVITISDLPKTNTGKIMRRVLKAKILGESLGDLSSLENPQVLDEIITKI